jgi:glycine cleavage system H protein
VYPDELRYTGEHEWVRRQPDGALRVGITHYAQDALGDIVFVTLPDSGTEVTEGRPLGEVESTKSVSDIYAPVSGEVVSRNERLESQPDLVNSDPYGDGWMLDIRPADDSALDRLMDAAAYRELVESQD